MSKLLPKLLASDTLFDTFFSVRRDRLLYPNNHEGDYYVLSTVKRSVAIVAQDANGHLLITQEYRHPTKKVLFGCPGGLVDSGESYLEAAKRELREETGCQADELTLLATTYPLPGVLDQTMGIVHAKGVKVVSEKQLDAQEIIDWQFMPHAALIDSVKRGCDIDSILCSALFFLSTCAK
jgi:ADP-ribose pyrophosphatase